MEIAPGEGANKERKTALLMEQREEHSGSLVLSGSPDALPGSQHWDLLPAGRLGGSRFPHTGARLFTVHPGGRSVKMQEVEYFNSTKATSLPG